MNDQDPENFQIELDKEKELKEIWSEHQDRDGDTIPVNKVADAYWSVGYILGPTYTKKFEEELEAQHGNLVSYEDTKELFRENMIKKLNMDFYKNLFRILDKNKEGIIPAENLKKILAKLPDTDEQEVDEMIAAIDDDGNGEVSFDGRSRSRSNTKRRRL